MRSVSRFVPRFDALESHVCLSDLLSMPASSTWISPPTTTQDTIQTVTIPTATVDPSQSPIVLAGGVDGVMPTTPGVNLDIYPPAASYLGVPGIPQVPVTPQDPNGVLSPTQGVGPMRNVIVPFPNPTPYYPPPYGVPTYVTLSNMSVSNVT